MTTDTKYWYCRVVTKFAFFPVRVEQLYIHPFREGRKKWIWLRTYYELVGLAYDGGVEDSKVVASDEALKSWGFELWYPMPRK